MKCDITEIQKVAPGCTQKISKNGKERSRNKKKW